jgi:ATPase subunit of ABC transporter with duplicated ATPase domains
MRPLSSARFQPLRLSSENLVSNFAFCKCAACRYAWVEKKRNFLFPIAERSSKIVARVENLTHGYDEKTLFQNTSLQVDRGERVAMIGANGGAGST